MRNLLGWIAALSIGCSQRGPEVARGDAGAESALPVVLAAAPAGPRDAGFAVAVADIPVPLDPATSGWNAGHRYAYDVVLTSRVAFGSGASAVDFDLHARLEIVPVRVTRTSAWIHAELSNGIFESRVPGTQASFDRLATELRRPYVTVLSGGRIEESQVAKDTDALVVGIYRTIGAALQFARPVTPAARWTAVEHDTTGPYVAEYERADERTFTKIKRRYDGLLKQAAGGAELPTALTPHVTASTGSITLAADGRPLSIALADELHFDGSQSPIASKTTVTLEAKSDSTAPAPLAPSGADMVHLRPDEPYAPASATALLDDARIANLSFETIIARLEASPPESAGAAAPDRSEVERKARDDAKLFAALSATFRKRPPTVATAVAKIRAGSPATQMLIDALASSGSDIAQDALAEMALSSSITTERLKALVFALSRTTSPSDVSVRALASFIHHDVVGTQALYGLGTFTRIFRDRGQAERSKAVARTLLAELAAAETEQRTSRCLRAIANSGFAGALSKVRPYLTDPREQLRADAIQALRSMQSSEVDRIVAERLRSDSAMQVKMTAIEVAGARTPTDALIAAVETATAPAVEAHVRYRATELLAKWLPERADVRPLLEAVAARDTEERVRRLARVALENGA